MLLSARRSLLLLPAAAPDGAAAQNLSLLQAAAARLNVPVANPHDIDWQAGLATGRNQLVATGLLGAPETTDLPPDTQIFQVIDCLPESEQPREEDWRTMAATPVTAEMVVFEWLERGATVEFRDLIRLIK